MSTKSFSETKTIDELIQLLQSQQPHFTDKYDVVAFGVFGSRIHGDHTADSDLDILVEFSTPPTLFQFIRLQDELSALLDLPVDLVMKSALKPQISEQILAEVISV